jgi:hypothetical protein
MLAAERRGEEGDVPFRGGEVDRLCGRDEPISIHDGGRNRLPVVVCDVDHMAAGHQPTARRNRKGSPGKARRIAVTVHADDREGELGNVHAFGD